jgi:hypothetical protein
MSPGDLHVAQQVDSLLTQRNLAWLFGAGTSVNSNIPLMNALTEQVIARTRTEAEAEFDVLNTIKSDLPDTAHIEHMLSQIADLRAIAERSKNRVVVFGPAAVSAAQLDTLHQRLLQIIADTVRWGYTPATSQNPERIGTRDNPLVTVDHHRVFMKSLFSGTQKGLEDRRSAVRFFTTNYDTLLEDSLSLEGIPHWDGFDGGAVAFRSFKFGDPDPPESVRAWVVKLHGSIDWKFSEDGRILRVRDTDSYPTGQQPAIIYPKAEKYVATQRDPFAAQFELLRRTLTTREENVLGICGYSFGDEHINQEIEQAMEQGASKTTILAFAQSTCPTLEKWQSSSWSKRLYLILPSGIYVGGEGPHSPPRAGHNHEWWTFAGVSRLLESGAEHCAQ